MKASGKVEALYERWEGAVAFRLFADSAQPTLTVPEQIAARVGDRIISGALAPGSRIIEQELASEFEVSRGPVRDAVRMLEREDLVTVLPRRGAVVTSLSIQEVTDIFEVRAGLFEIVARKVAAARNPELLRLLEAGVARLERLAAMKDDDGAYAETSYRLSILSARSCGNERLVRMITALCLQTLRYSKLSLKSAARRQQSARIWREAFTALMQGDRRRYVELARRRVEESGAEAVRQLAHGDGASPAVPSGRSKGGRASPARDATLRDGRVVQ